MFQRLPEFIIYFLN